MDIVRHISPIITEFDPSHGKYGPDRKHSSTPNLSMEVMLELRKAIGKKAVVVSHWAFRGKYVQKKTQNGTFEMNFLQVDVSSSIL